MTFGSSFPRVILVSSMVLILGCAYSTRASSFSVTSNGVFSIGLTSTGFSLSAAAQNVLPQIPALGFLGPAGSTLNLGGSPYLSAADFLSGSVSVNGSGYPIWFNHFPPAGSVAVLLDIHIAAGAVTVPISTDPTIQLTAPIVLTVAAVGHTVNFSPVFSAAFYGTGTATLTLQRQGSLGYGTQRISYQFDLVQTPEPATLLLLGSGLLGIIGTTYRKRNQK